MKMKALKRLGLLVLVVDPYKILYTAIVSFFFVVREEASRKLVHSQVISKAFAALALLRTWIGAVAILKIFFYITFFHALFPQESVSIFGFAD